MLGNRRVLDLEQGDREQRDRQSIQLRERPRAERRELALDSRPPAQGSVDPGLQLGVSARRQAGSAHHHCVIETAAAVDHRVHDTSGGGTRNSTR